MNKRRSKNEWQRLIDEQAASDLTQKAFCAQAGIAVATLAIGSASYGMKVRPVPMSQWVCRA